MKSTTDLSTLSMDYKIARQFSTDQPSGQSISIPRVEIKRQRCSIRQISSRLLSISWWLRLSCILSIIGFILHLISFVSPYWMLVSDSLGISYSGLWTVCIFEQCGDFLNHSMHSWFHVVQMVMCLSLLSQILTITSLIISIIQPSFINDKRKPATACAFITIFISGVCSTVGVLLYGLEQGKRGIDTLAWAYYMSLAGLFFIIASLTTTGFELKVLSRKNADEVPILNRTDSQSNQTLRHSISVDSCASLRTIETPLQIAVQTKRPRSESQVRMRVNSVSCITTLPEENEECKSAPFYLDNEVF